MSTTPEGKTTQQGRGLMLDGRKAFVKLDPFTWQAIDLLATSAEVKWSDWVRSVWAAATKDVPPERWDEINRAGVLRTFAIGQLLRRLETQGSLINQLLQGENRPARIEIKLSDDLALVASNDRAVALGETIKAALAAHRNIRD